MQPPGFIRYYDEKRLQRPYCFECVYFATENGTSQGLCWEYGAYVSLYSSCKAFERRTGSSTPIVGPYKVEICYRLGLDELLKQI